jgi:hypothetical protein
MNNDAKDRIFQLLREDGVSEAVMDQLHLVFQDAARWRMLLSCERIRVLGSARLGTADPHVGLELWANHPEKKSGLGCQVLTEFVDGMIKG